MNKETMSEELLNELLMTWLDSQIGTCERTIKGIITDISNYETALNNCTNDETELIERFSNSLNDANKVKQIMEFRLTWLNEQLISLQNENSHKDNMWYIEKYNLNNLK